MSKKVNYNKVLDVLLKIWAVCFGSITVVAFAGWFVPHFWLPILSFSMILAVTWSGNRFMSTGHINCALMMHYTIYALLAATLVMMVINYVYDKDIVVSWLRLAGDKSHTTVNLPYITSCIIYPAAAISYLVAIFRRSRTQYCRHCHERAGFTVREALEHGQFISETKRALYLCFWLCVVMTAIEIIYFLAFYDDTNINTSDTYFFFICPVIVYVLSIVSLAMRFQNRKFEISVVADVGHPGNQCTHVRFMVVRKDRILLHQVLEGDGTLQLWDTPATDEMPLAESVSDVEATSIFSKISGISAFRVRHLFDTSTTDSNAFHFAAFVDDDVQSTDLEGEWLNLFEIDTMLKTGLIARPFAYEIHRVYTMTMAWKTYDREGNRLYPIKNYKPTFRLSDFKDWDVDYTDMVWRLVAENNADRPFFRLRKFWHRYVTGSSKKWKRND